jgi:hypothetical protein
VTAILPGGQRMNKPRMNKHRRLGVSIQQGRSVAAASLGRPVADPI